MNCEYSDEEVRQKVVISIGVLFKNDAFLLENNVSERSVAHKLAEYLQEQFPDWHVDCEYNRKGLDSKVLEGISECSAERPTDRVLPDIIVHERNTQNNLLVIEIKTNNQESKCDMRKLELFTSKSGKYKYYKYRLGLFIRFNGLDAPKLKWIEDGKEKDWI